MQTNKSSLLLSFKKEDSSFLKKRSKRLLIISALAVLGAGTAALASGDWFQDALFTNRTGFLLATPETGLSPRVAGHATDGLQARVLDTGTTDLSYDPAEAEKQLAGLFAHQRAAAEAQGADAGIIAGIAAMRRAPTGDAAWARGDGLPPAIRLYTAGAVDFDAGAGDLGQARFAAVLNLPPPLAAPRASWAAYMLGRIAAGHHDRDAADAAFAQVRTLALAGAPDPLGLAVASYGQQARLRYDGGDLPGAFTLYLAQERHGDSTAGLSLQFTARRALQHPESWPADLADPAIRDVMVREAVHESGDGDVAPPLQAFARKMLETARPDDPADVLAAMAYRMGDFADADAFAQRTKAPFALWLRAKLALQKGDDAAAAALFSQALHAITPGTPGGDRLGVEAGAMQVRRGDFLLAFQTLWAHVDNVNADFGSDVAYLADRVLTTDELKDFVDRHVPAVSATGSFWSYTKAAMIRQVLAARLMREARTDAALAYFPDAAIRGKADAYRQALIRAAAERGVAKAQDVWRAALLLRWSGLEMTGTWLDPDGAGTDGALGGATGFDRGGDLKPGDYVSAERARFDASAPSPNKRYHYRYLAVDQARAAAALVPPRSQAAAAMLCQAAGWMRTTSDAPATRALWRAYVHTGAFVAFAKNFGKHCPDPDFTAARTTGRKLLLISAHDFIHRHKAPLGIAAAATLLAPAALIRRRKAQTP